LLIIDSDEHDWYTTFQNQTTESGQGFNITRTRWENMTVSSESHKKPTVRIEANKKPMPNTSEDQNRQFMPDFVLVRKLVRGLKRHEDYSNALFGLMYCNTPSINNLESVYLCLERPVVFAALNGIHKRLGKEFPLINQSYYSHHNTMIFFPELPVVAKVGWAQAGYGKMKIDNPDDLKDFGGVIALNNDYVTLEEYVSDRVYDLRIQKIGTHLRAYKRTSSYWKGNVGTSIIEEIDVTDQFKLWAHEAGKLFGGMDILTVDAIHTENGDDYILEINDTASGFWKNNEVEDMGYVKDLIIERIDEQTKRENEVISEKKEESGDS